MLSALGSSVCGTLVVGIYQYIKVQKTKQNLLLFQAHATFFINPINQMT